MSNKLEELALRLNTCTTAEGTQYSAEMQDNMLKVVCSNNDEFPIHILVTDTQILTISHLFSVEEVDESVADDLNRILLGLNPAIPLSSVGIQDGQYILYGAMAIDSLFENLAHELEVQAENVIELLDAVSSMLSKNS